MKRVLYLSNIEVPYRVEFFNQLARECDLTVLYERRQSANRDSKWASSQEKKYTTAFLDGINIFQEYTLSFKIFKYIFGDYDIIIVGCINSLVQLLAILVMRVCKIDYILSNDGERFLYKDFKFKLKHLLMSGAKAYVTAGNVSATAIKQIFPTKPVYSYQFSSLTEDEIKINSSTADDRDNYILVVGQYFDYKGMDVALRVARKDRSIMYKFVGMGKRTDLFINEHSAQNEPNIEFIPFLQKENLEKEYKRCRLLLLPTRGECWGLVVNEAASFGTPIVSTWGSGAAVEFLQKDYPELLAEPDNVDSLYTSIKVTESINMPKYTNFLIRKSREYSIEKMVEIHKKVIDL